MPRPRSNSKFIGELVSDNIADVFVIVDGKEVLLEEADISDATLLGKGQQGAVYAAIVSYTENNTIEKRPCALKSLQSKHASNANHHACITETQHSSTDDCTIKLMTIVENDGEAFALLPYCELFLDQMLTKIKQQDSIRRNALILHIFSDLIFALNRLHEKGFVHGDIKPENIAFYLERFCLIDLDCARPIYQEVRSLYGSPYFMHPQCFNDRNYCTNPHNDIHALGIILKMLLSDEALLAWMASWDAKIKNISAMDMLQKIGIEKAAFLNLILTAETLTQPKVNETETSEIQLKKLADSMTTITQTDNDEISAEEIMTRLASIKEKFLQENQLSEAGFSQLVSSFYNGLRAENKHPFDQEVIQIHPENHSTQNQQPLLINQASFFRLESNPSFSAYYQESFLNSPPKPSPEETQSFDANSEDNFTL